MSIFKKSDGTARGWVGIVVAIVQAVLPLIGRGKNKKP